MVNNEDRNVREHYQAVVHNVLAEGQQEDVVAFCSHFEGRYQDIVDMFHEQIVRNQEDVLILRYILQSLNSLAYYARNHGGAFLELCQKREILPQL